MRICKTVPILWALIHSLNTFIEHLLCQTGSHCSETREHSDKQDKFSNVNELIQMRSTETNKRTGKPPLRRWHFYQRYKWKGKSHANIWGGKQEKEHQKKEGINSKVLEGERELTCLRHSRKLILLEGKTNKRWGERDGHTICILEGSVSGFGFYSEYEEKTLNFKKITLAAREITGEELE